MPTVTLDANTIRTAVCPAGQCKLDLYDTTIPGFVLEVRPSGGKTWYLRYRDGRGKQHQHRIGDAAGITFEQARTAAQTTRAKVILGENPAEEKKAPLITSRSRCLMTNSSAVGSPHHHPRPRSLQAARGNRQADAGDRCRRPRLEVAVHLPRAEHRQR